MAIGSYSKILTIGHGAVREVLTDPVVVEEKVDGSQFSFGRRGDELFVRSKGAMIDPYAPPAMFKAATETAQRLHAQGLLNDGWTYRGEVLAQPRHNALAYARVPVGNVIIFDIDRGLWNQLNYDEKALEAQRLGLEVVPCFFRGKLEEPAQLRQYLNAVSILGGNKVEGVVVKTDVALAPLRIGADGKPLVAKLVSEAFKEIHHGAWKADNPTPNDVLQKLSAKYTSPARWAKAAQKMAEAGTLTNEPRDIGKLVELVKADLLEECTDEIKQDLFDWVQKHVLRYCVQGLPEWYRNRLLEESFEVKSDAA